MRVVYVLFAAAAVLATVCVADDEEEAALASPPEEEEIDIFAAPVSKASRPRRAKKAKVVDDDLPGEVEEVAPAVEVDEEEVEEPSWQVEFAVQLKRGETGRFVLEVNPSWAPVGARRFAKLIEENFYAGNRFFRVVPKFAVQWGINGKPEANKKWQKKGKVLKDDYRNYQSNSNFTVSFATSGAKTRKTQVFINTGHNEHLNKMGFIPFARVIEGTDVVRRIFSGYGDEIKQERILEEGNSFLKKEYPKLSYIIRTKRLEGDDQIPTPKPLPTTKPKITVAERLRLEKEAEAKILANIDVNKDVPLGELNEL